MRIVKSGKILEVTCSSGLRRNVSISLSIASYINALDYLCGVEVFVSWYLRIREKTLVASGRYRFSEGVSQLGVRRDRCDSEEKWLMGINAFLEEFQCSFGNKIGGILSGKSLPFLVVEGEISVVVHISVRVEQNYNCKQSHCTEE